MNWRDVNRRLHEIDRVSWAIAVLIAGVFAYGAVVLVLWWIRLAVNWMVSP